MIVAELESDRKDEGGCMLHLKGILPSGWRKFKPKEARNPNPTPARRSPETNRVVKATPAGIVSLGDME